MDLSPLIVYSIGSSAYGTNIPGFTFIEMLDCLNRAFVLPYRPIAVSLGGEADQGIGIFGIQNHMDFLAIAKKSGVYLIQEKTLDQSMKKRMHLYQKKAGPQQKPFVSCRPQCNPHFNGNVTGRDFCVGSGAVSL